MNGKPAAAQSGQILIPIHPLSFPPPNPAMNDPETVESDRRSTLLAWLELIRLPNLFTSMADVAMGFFFVRAVEVSTDGWVLGLLVAASAAIYAAGVAMNDLFDLEEDARQRPERPLPSGRIAPGAARLLVAGLLVAALVAAGGASLLVHHPLPALVAFMLVMCVVAYDAVLKRTPLGPLAMGSCRMFNVLLGMSVLATAGERLLPWGTPEWLVAAAIGLYVVGLTWFARREAGQSDHRQLALATVVMVAGIGLLALLPDRIDPARLVSLLQAQPWRWQILMMLLALWLGWRNLKAVFHPSPLHVRMVVRQGILSLVVLDAAVAFAVRGRVEAIAILLLLLPAALLGRWVYST